MTNRAHPVLTKSNKALSVPSLIDEIEACQAFGLIPDVTHTINDDKNYFALPRETRAFLVAYMRLKRVTTAIVDYDSAKQAEKMRAKRD